MESTSLPSLSSRLRILIAKTHRAEKLYSSMANDNLSNPTPKIPKLQGEAQLGKLANDIRAKEWQISHEELRLSLNEVLRLGSSTAILDSLEMLHEQYYAKFIESSVMLERGTEALFEAVKRQEFVHILKLGIEMVKQKARSQVSQVIADELKLLVSGSGREASSVNSLNTSKRISLETSTALDSILASRKGARSVTRLNVDVSDKVVPIQFKRDSK